MSDAIDKSQEFGFYEACQSLSSYYDVKETEIPQHIC